MALRPLGKDVQDQSGAVDHPGFQFGFQVALLRGRQDVVEHHHFSATGRYRGGDFGHLASAGEIGRVRLVAPAADQADLGQTGACAKQAELGNGIIVVALAEVERDQHRGVGDAWAQCRLVGIKHERS